MVFPEQGARRPVLHFHGRYYLLHKAFLPTDGRLQAHFGPLTDLGYFRAVQVKSHFQVTSVTKVCGIVDISPLIATPLSAFSALLYM